jgi:hypothetical protein
LPSRLIDVAEAFARLLLGGVSRHAARDQVIDAERDVRLDLFEHFSVELSTAPDAETKEPRGSWHASDRSDSTG